MFAMLRATRGLLFALFALAPRDAGAFREYIPLRAVQVLTLHAERPTRARREPERPQLACGGSACALWNQTVRIAPPIEAGARARASPRSGIGRRRAPKAPSF